MGWSCSSCSSSNASDAQATCAQCGAIRVLECPVCHLDIRYGPRLNVGATVFHPDCFRCSACHEKLAGRFQTKDGEFYHFECYKTLFHPRCAVCEGFIPFLPGTNRISFKVMPYWDLKFCPEHETDDRCCSCQRVEPQQKDRRFHALSDGRKVCHDCCDSLVLDTHEAQDVVKEVWAFMESVGIRNPDIPLYLVDAPALNEHCAARHGPAASKKPQTDNRAVVSHVTRGLCLSEVSRVQHMVRRGNETVPQVVSIEMVSLPAWLCCVVVANHLLTISTTVQNRSVNAILVLHGLPADLTASVLAHEATHAYIKLRDDFPEQIPKQVSLLCEQA